MGWKKRVECVQIWELSTVDTDVGENQDSNMLL